MLQTLEIKLNLFSNSCENISYWSIQRKKGKYFGIIKIIGVNMLIFLWEII